MTFHWPPPCVVYVSDEFHCRIKHVKGRKKTGLAFSHLQGTHRHTRRFFSTHGLPLTSYMCSLRFWWISKQLKAEKGRFGLFTLTGYTQAQWGTRLEDNQELILGPCVPKNPLCACVYPRNEKRPNRPFSAFNVIDAALKFTANVGFTCRRSMEGHVCQKTSVCACVCHVNVKRSNWPFTAFFGLFGSWKWP